MWPESQLDIGQDIFSFLEIYKYQKVEIFFKDSFRPFNSTIILPGSVQVSPFIVAQFEKKSNRAFNLIVCRYIFDVKMNNVELVF